MDENTIYVLKSVAALGSDWEMSWRDSSATIYLIDAGYIRRLSNNPLSPRVAQFVVTDKGRARAATL